MTTKGEMYKTLGTVDIINLDGKSYTLDYKETQDIKRGNPKFLSITEKHKKDGKDYTNYKPTLPQNLKFFESLVIAFKKLDKKVNFSSVNSNNSSTEENKRLQEQINLLTKQNQETMLLLKKLQSKE